MRIKLINIRKKEYACVIILLHHRNEDKTNKYKEKTICMCNHFIAPQNYRNSFGSHLMRNKKIFIKK